MGDGVTGLPDRVMKYAWREVPRAPDSALLLLSSAQPGVVQFCSREGWHVILFNYVIRVIRTDLRRCAIGSGGGADRTNEEEKDRKRYSHIPSSLILLYELATSYSRVSAALPSALRTQPLWNCSYSINFTLGVNYHKIIGFFPLPPPRFIRAAKLAVQWNVLLPI